MMRVGVLLVHGTQGVVLTNSVCFDAGLAAFVRDGAVLPRIKAKTDSNVAQKESNMALGETGAPQESHRPREAPATPQEDPATPPKDSDSPADGPAPVPFQSPPSLQRSFKLSHCENITGMGIPEGVTVIVGQDEEAKTTLLHALSMGCYNHTLDGAPHICVSLVGFLTRLRGRRQGVCRGVAERGPDRERTGPSDPQCRHLPVHVVSFRQVCAEKHVVQHRERECERKSSCGYCRGVCDALRVCHLRAG